jgi:hypothetical protein
MDRVEFFGLERPIQERFIESTRGTGAPAPVLLELPGPNVRALSWGGAGVLLLLACIAFARLGYGNLEHPLALTPTWGLAVFIGLLTLSAACGLRAFALFGADQSLPFQRGIYAFPSTAIDARSAALLLYCVFAGSTRHAPKRSRGSSWRFASASASRPASAAPATWGCSIRCSTPAFATRSPLRIECAHKWSAGIAFYP